METSFMIKLGGRKAEYIWSSPPDDTSKSSIDLKVRVSPSELIWLARNLNCLIENSRILVPNLDAYNRLLVYACVRPTLRSSRRIRSLFSLVLNINSWDAHYWASKFREIWWRYEAFRPITRVARAFKLFFNLSG